VHLRRFRVEDAAVYHLWNADDEQTRNLDQVPWPSDAAAVARWAASEAGREPAGDNIRLVIADADDVAVGDVTVHDADPRTGTFSWGVSIRPDVRGRGYASEALTLVLRYLFHERRYQKANAGIYAFNDVSIRLHERLGFQLEGRQRRMTYTGGRFHDLLLYGLTREEFDATQQPPED
jgi:RimJ/RimL family protein N-acetyltransferase